MANIYLVRHAQSLANVAKVYQGQSFDTDLSPFGVMQANLVAEYLASWPIAEVITSPLKRTEQTAQEIAVMHNLPLQIDDRLMETNHGDWEGRLITDLQENDQDLWNLWTTYPSQTKFPNGEKFTQTASRVLEWWGEICKHKKNIAVVTHENIIQIILTHLNGVSLDRIWEFGIANTSVTLIETGKQVRLRAIGDISHLETLDLQ